MPKLLSLNIEGLKRSIDILALPQMFEDAICFARRLSIFYVWIDALCIIQDDDEDKDPEIAKMDHIYWNAILNVGAIAAAESVSDLVSTGLFVDRDPHEISPFAPSIKRENYEQICFTWVDDGWDVHLCARFQRGWVLQERILSRRTVYFGRQLRWECSEIIANEAFLCRIPRLIDWRGVGEPGIDAPFRLRTLLTRRSGDATERLWCDDSNYFD
jgi:hypothetical protein